jgi:hypothetical protein
MTEAADELGASTAPPAAALDPGQVRGAKYLGKVLPLLARLRPDGCARDRAGNRTLFYDGYGGLVLLSMFSPAMDSLRAVQQASALKKVQKLLGCSRASLGSLSEAARVFDPDLLKGVAAELGADLKPLATDPRREDPVRRDAAPGAPAARGQLVEDQPVGRADARLADALPVRPLARRPVGGRGDGLSQQWQVR